MKKTISFGILFFLALLCGCTKEQGLGEDPYGNARPPLDISLERVVEVIDIKVGELLKIKGKGFLQHKDLSVKLNELVLEVKSIEEDQVQVRIPEGASTGLITLLVDREVLVGPRLRIKGAMLIDGYFESLPGVDGEIKCIVPFQNQQFLIGGNFANVNNTSINKLALINKDGAVEKGFNTGKGFESGSVNTITILNSNKVLIGGSFGNYNAKFNIGGYISNIVQLNKDGSLDSAIVYSEQGRRIMVPSLNVYFDGPVNKIVTSREDNKIYVLGEFKYYMQKDFTGLTKDGLRDSVRIDSVKMDGLVRLHPDGSLDKAYNYNPISNESYPGFNGPLSDVMMINNDQLLVVGNFTKYNGKSANRIVRLTGSGVVDDSFAIGTGADGRINKVIQITNDSYLVVGAFNNIHGKPRKKIALINRNGLLRSDSGIGKMDGPDGIVSNAILLKNNTIFLAGLFENFSKYSRRNIAVMNMDGSLDEQNNTLGALTFGKGRGLVNDLISLPGDKSFILVGDFTHFDFYNVNRIVKVTYE